MCHEILPESSALAFFNIKGNIKNWILLWLNYFFKENYVLKILQIFFQLQAHSYLLNSLFAFSQVQI